MGGTPASENMHTAMTAAYSGLRWFRPARSLTLSDSKPPRESNRITPKVPSVVNT